MTVELDKAAVTDAVRARFREELASLEALVAQSRDEATSPESRPENKYDTRATEASYLAAGQGQRLVELRRLVAFLENDAAVARGVVLYALDGDAGPAWYLLAPDGGGARVRVGSAEVVVVTPASPVGAALAASHEGDAVRIGPAHASAEYEVRAIR